MAWPRSSLARSLPLPAPCARREHVAQPWSVVTTADRAMLAVASCSAFFRLSDPDAKRSKAGHMVVTAARRAAVYFPIVGGPVPNAAVHVSVRRR